MKLIITINNTYNLCIIFGNFSKNFPKNCFSIKRIIKDKDVFVALTNYKDSSLTYTIRVWVNSGDFFNVKFDLLEKIKEQFDEKKIEIPYNQLDVHIQK